MPQALKDIATEWFDAEVRNCVAERRIDPQFVLIPADYVLVVIRPEPSMMNNGRYKDIMARMVRKKVQEVNAEAYFFLSDTWYGQVCADPDNPLLERAMKEGWSVTEMEKHGLVKKHQAIVGMVETRDNSLTMCLRHDYDLRNGEIVLGKRFVTDEYKVGSGRFSGIFQERESAYVLLKKTTAQ